VTSRIGREIFQSSNGGELVSQSVTRPSGFADEIEDDPSPTSTNAIPIPPMQPSEVIKSLPQLSPSSSKYLSKSLISLYTSLALNPYSSTSTLEQYNIDLTEVNIQSRLSDLTHLDLSNLPNLTDTSLTRLRVLKNLTNLNISTYTATSKLTNIALESIQTLSLEELRLSGSTLITSVPGQWPFLRVLDLSGAFQLSDDAISILLSNAPLLHVLNLSYCWRVSSF
jgi:hypothetical protein